MTRMRERNLDDGEVAVVVQVLDGWKDKLTWHVFIEVVERREGLRYING